MKEQLSLERKPTTHVKPRKKEWSNFEKMSFLIPFMKAVNKTENGASTSDDNIINGATTSNDSNIIDSFKASFSVSPLPVAEAEMGCQFHGLDMDADSVASESHSESEMATSAVTVREPLSLGPHPTKTFNPTFMSSSSSNLHTVGKPKKRKMYHDASNNDSNNYNNVNNDATTEFIKAIKEFKSERNNNDDEQFFKSCIPMLQQLTHVQKLEFRISVQQLLLRFLRETDKSPESVMALSKQE